MEEQFRSEVKSVSENFSRMLEALEEHGEILVAVAGTLLKAFEAGHKALVFGNGGSAADAQHFAAELVGRYKKERRGFPALALSTDTSAITAIGNDYGFGRVFERQVEALGRPGDVALGISTSGNSENVLLAVRKANEMGLATVALLGNDGGAIGKEARLKVVFGSGDTPRVQEYHAVCIHVICSLIEHRVAGEVG